MTSTRPSEEFATVEELAEAVERLTPQERNRLYKQGNILALGSEFTDGKDLLNEAVKRSLIGSSGERRQGERGRPWPKGVSLVAFLMECMSSIANASQKSFRQKLNRKAEALTTENGEPNPELAKHKLHYPSVEEELIDMEEENARQAAAEADVAAIRGFFKKGDVVLDILDGEELGMSVDEIREMTDATPTSYDSARRRLRRTVDKFMPGRRRK